jgi:anti-sigma regulatory factor (Ser/Thr protein kinase)
MTADVRQPTRVWPLTSHLELPALPTAVREARRHARELALKFGLSELVESIELAVSEIVTNAIRATSHLDASSLTNPVVRLSLASDLHCMMIRVWDASNQLPVRQDASPDDESGRGLMLVDFLASEWGAYYRETGKVVWAIVG